jgi:hypothetical protein
LDCKKNKHALYRCRGGLCFTAVAVGFATFCALKKWSEKARLRRALFLARMIVTGTFESFEERVLFCGVSWARLFLMSLK